MAESEKCPQALNSNEQTSPWGFLAGDIHSPRGLPVIFCLQGIVVDFGEGLCYYIQEFIGVFMLFRPLCSRG